MSYDELLERLDQEEETLLIELLNLTSSDIVEAFQNKIYSRQKYLISKYVSDGTQEDDEEEL